MRNKYSRLPITRTFKGNRKRFELSGVENKLLLLFIKLTIFYFLRADKKNDCTVVVTGKAINRGDGEGMHVPCTLNFKGHRKWIDILRKELIGKD